MEQMYMIEIFIEKVTIIAKDEDTSSTNKSLIIKVKFGPNVQFIIKESQLAVNEKEDDIVVTDENGRQRWSRTIRVGKSYLFPSFPDTLLMILSKFPLEIEVWNDDDSEPPNQIYVGVGNMHWHTGFFHMLKETSNPCKIHQPLSIKTKSTLMAECCCTVAGEVEFILRLSALGGSIITEFQQMLKDPDYFVFRTNKAPSMFKCQRVEGDDPNFCMVGSIYETTTLEDPDIIDKANKKIEVCTELQSCGMGGETDYVCDRPGKGSAKKKFAIDKVRMGDIIGPCGNANCALAQKVRMYIRELDSYKKKSTAITGTKPVHEKKVCGTCVCKDDRYHRDECPEKDKPQVKCTGCGGMTAPGSTCEQRKAKEFGTGATPKTSDTRINYLFSTTQFPNYTNAMFGHDVIVENCVCSKATTLVDVDSKACSTTSEDWTDISSVDECCCHKLPTTRSATKTYRSRSTTLSCGVNSIYNVATSRSYHSCRNQTKTSCQASSAGTNYTTICSAGTSAGNQCVGTSAPHQSAGTSTVYQEQNRKVQQVYYVTDVPEEKICQCTPKKPAPPCKTFDCECLAETANRLSRKKHKPYCPSYKHKLTCPVTMMNEAEEQGLEDDVEEVAPLPYGLPPIRLTPCPILGRPCSVPDGFARMYKNALVPTQPFSYSTDGKVCCSKEFERIKKAIREYMRNDKESDYRCINKFNVDTERRCCDKEQVLMSLLGKSCCGAHKMSIQEKYQEWKK